MVSRQKKRCRTTSQRWPKVFFSEKSFFSILQSWPSAPSWFSFFITTKKIIRSRGIGFDEIGKERYMPTDLVMVPIMVNLMLIFGFIFIGAILFASWEGWSPTTAAYFCFVTLTTIGFGDYTPVKSFNGFEHDPVAAMKMVFTVSYCIFGMTLLSMCMNLMQEKIVEKVATWLRAYWDLKSCNRCLGWRQSWECLGRATMRRLSSSASRARWESVVEKIFTSSSQLHRRENHQFLLIDGNINLDKMKMCNWPQRDHHRDRCKRPLKEKMETRQSLVSRRRSEKSPPSEVIFKNKWQIFDESTSFLRRAHIGLGCLWYWPGIQLEMWYNWWSIVIWCKRNVIWANGIQLWFLCVHLYEFEILGNSLGNV